MVLGQGTPQLWSSAPVPGTDAKADGRAGITCRNAPNHLGDPRGEGIADTAEMPRLMGSSLPGAAEATNSPHSVPQTEIGWAGCMPLSSVPVQFVTPYSDRHSLGALPGVVLMLLVFQLLRKAF